MLFLLLNLVLCLESKDPFCKSISSHAHHRPYCESGEFRLLWNMYSVDICLSFISKRCTVAFAISGIRFLTMENLFQMKLYIYVIRRKIMQRDVEIEVETVD